MKLIKTLPYFQADSAVAGYSAEVGRYVTIINELLNKISLANEDGLISAQSSAQELLKSLDEVPLTLITQVVELINQSRSTQWSGKFRRFAQKTKVRLTFNRQTEKASRKDNERLKAPPSLNVPFTFETGLHL